MASRGIRLMLQKSPAPSRWLSNATSSLTVEPEPEPEPEAAASETAKVVSKRKQKEISLFERLSQFIRGPNKGANLEEFLDRFVSERRKPIKRFEVINCIQRLRLRRDYELALQIFRWIESTDIEMSDSDHALLIDFLAKVEGLETAEKYFDCLEVSATTTKTYGALLNCYCEKKSLERALELFNKMKELGFVSALNYNNMIKLYSIMKQPSEIRLLVQEMKSKNIIPDLFTYQYLLESLASENNFDGVEQVKAEMRKNKIKFDWSTHATLVNIYFRAGFPEKANAELAMIEKKKPKDHEAFHFLITSYARSSDLSGVNRAWESLKSKCQTPSNLSYHVMLVALSKLGELENLERCFREWELVCKNYDVGLANLMLESYLKRNMVEKAELLYENILRRGREPDSKTLDLLMSFHLRHSQIDLALKYLEVVASKPIPGKPDYFPVNKIANMFLKHFRNNIDTDRVERFCTSLKQIGHVDPIIYASLNSLTTVCGKAGA